MQKFSIIFLFFIFSGSIYSPFIYNLFKVILFSVNVPVLSEHITFTLPIVSQATIFLTKAFCLAILIIFIERETATIVGKPSGTEATIKTMLVIKASEIFTKLASPILIKLINCIIKTIAAANIPIKAIFFPNSASFSCKGVEVFLVDDNSRAIFPNSVLSPTEVITILPFPVATKEPE